MLLGLRLWQMDRSFFYFSVHNFPSFSLVLSYIIIYVSVWCGVSLAHTLYLSFCSPNNFLTATLGNHSTSHLLARLGSVGEGESA